MVSSSAAAFLVLFFDHTSAFPSNRRLRRKQEYYAFNLGQPWTDAFPHTNDEVQRSECARLLFRCLASLSVLCDGF